MKIFGREKMLIFRGWESENFAEYYTLTWINRNQKKLTTENTESTEKISFREEDYDFNREVCFIRKFIFQYWILINN